MPDKIRSVAIMTKRFNDEAESAAKKVARLLSAGHVKVSTVDPFVLRDCVLLKPDRLAEARIDLVLAIGGDGTTLRAFRTISDSIPVMTMNIGGHRGILSEIDTDSLEDAVHSLLAGRCFVDSRIRIQAEAGGVVFPPALNDILITRSDLTRTPLLSIKLMGDEISQRMDGIVVSTPTGSTGHSFSIGGPVLHEGMSCLILSPIAPVNRMPQLVIPVEDVQLTSTYDSVVVIDGQEVYPVEAGKVIRIFQHKVNANFLRLNKKGMRQLARLGF